MLTCLIKGLERSLYNFIKSNGDGESHNAVASCRTNPCSQWVFLDFFFLFWWRVDIRQKPCLGTKIFLCFSSVVNLYTFYTFPVRNLYILPELLYMHDGTAHQINAKTWREISGITSLWRQTCYNAVMQCLLWELIKCNKPGDMSSTLSSAKSLEYKEKGRNEWGHDLPRWLLI